MEEARWCTREGLMGGTMEEARWCTREGLMVGHYGSG